MSKVRMCHYHPTLDTGVLAIVNANWFIEIMGILARTFGKVILSLFTAV